MTNRVTGRRRRGAFQQKRGVGIFIFSFHHSFHFLRKIMSATRARRLVSFKDFTHYLGISLSTPTSTPQFNASFARFAGTSSAVIPRLGICNPDILRLDLGRLKLKSERDFEACAKLLHNFDILDLIRVAATSTASDQLTPVQNVPLPARRDSLQRIIEIDHSPLKIDLSGLFSRCNIHESRR